MLRTLMATGILALVLWACSSRQSAEESAKGSPTIAEAASPQTEVHGMEKKEITLNSPLNAAWVAAGEGIYDLKCLACHKLTADKLVGPGWLGVTQRREPLWIVNMITNVDMMLDTDPEAQKLLEECLVRMPNQNISDEEALQLLEFMRSNDGEK